jgi:hypothetical protein
MEETIIEPHRYQRFVRANGIPYAFVKLTLDEFMFTEIPDDAKWCFKSVEYDEERNITAYELRTLPEFVAWSRVVGDDVYIMLCACQAPTWRQKAVTFDDLDEWDNYLGFVFGITFDEWMTYEEVLPILEEQTEI